MLKTSKDTKSSVLALCIFIPPHTLVAGHYVFMLAVRVYVLCSTSIHPSAHRFRSMTEVFSNGFHSNCTCTNCVLLGIVNGQISIINHRVMALVNIPEMVFGL